MKRENKKLLSYFLIAVVALVCCFGEISAQNKKQFSFESKAKIYPVEKNQDLEIFVNNVGKYDAITLEAQSSSRVIEVKAWEVSYSYSSASVQAVGASQIEAINSFSEEAISFDGKTLLINKLSEANKRKAIHLLLPTGVTAKVYVNGELICNRTISTSSSVMLQDSKTISNKGYSPRATLLQAISKEPNNNKNILQQVDAQTLRKLATKIVNPQKIDEKTEKWAMLQVTVKETGLVSSVFYAGGDERLANIASDALKQFTFQPFLVNDKAVVVSSLIGVSLSGGQIKLFSEIHK